MSTEQRPNARLPKASDILAQDLRRRILGDGMPVGAPLQSEAELIEEFGYSRGTVREALRLLEAEGLIRVRRGAHGGIFVTHPDPSQVVRSLAALFTLADTPLWQLTDFRSLVEPVAARRAAEFATSDQRDELIRLGSGVDVETDRTHRDTSHAFHHLIAQSAQHELLHIILVTIYELMYWHGGQEFEEEHQHRHDMIRAHRKIAKCIAEGDGDAAERAMRQHLDAEHAVMAEKGGLDRPIIRRSTWRTR